MQEVLGQLVTVRLSFSGEGLFVINLTLALIMFGVIPGIRTEGFNRIGKNPKPVLIGFLSQFILFSLIILLWHEGPSGT